MTLHRFGKNQPYSNEANRVQALKRLDIIDTPTEKEFDDLVALAAQICQTPVAGIAFADETRAWFKSKLGVPFSEIPLQHSFCTYNIKVKGLFIVTDAHLDERFSGNPLVTGTTLLRFYAGVTIYSPDHFAIGTLFVLDHIPRNLNSEILASLKSLGKQVEKLLELRLQIKNLRHINDKLKIRDAAFVNMAGGVTLQDANGHILDLNKSAISILELDSSEGKKDPVSIDHVTSDIYREDGSRLPFQERPSTIAFRTGEVVRNKVLGIKINQAQMKWLDLTATPLYLHEDNSKPSHVISTFTDVTEFRKSQQVLMQAAKMRSLGEMAAGIAHEINTPLAVICLTAEQIKRDITKPEATRKSDEQLTQKLERIEKTGQRIATIVKGLRLFARESDQDPWTASIAADIVKEALALCAERFKNHNIEIRTDFDLDLVVECVPVQISQVILNLLGNAFDAVDALPEKWIHIQIKKIENQVRLSFTDSGLGISAATQAKLMTPFFTTKEIGKGTGLGLSISKGLIEKFKGHFYYDSQQPNTCFVIELPLISAQISLKSA